MKSRCTDVRPRWIVAMIAALLLACSPSHAQTVDGDTPAAAKSKPKSEKESEKKAKKAKDASDDASEKSGKKASSKKKSAEKDSKPAPAAAFEPKTVDVGKLPGPILSLHNCAPVLSKVEMAQERYGKSVLFFVSCPAKERGGYQLQAVYQARDARGAGAKRVIFEVPGADGNAATMDAIPSAIPARETYTEKVEERDVVRSRNDPPWITGAWRPEDREGVCAVVGHWRVQDAKAELWLWEEASECPKDGAPKYQTKLDKKPPALVGR